ncbi:hypothetical protein ACL6C3_21095 [Capilliphycus salinus ALCB114379]|uniref:hypothetical protein n=1 Tax=Capilliphycus salinus TaxID=2768948 RepID=UPI0039A439DF
MSVNSFSVTPDSGAGLYPLSAGNDKLRPNPPLHPTPDTRHPTPDSLPSHFV